MTAGPFGLTNKTMKRIAIQGAHGSFHDIAARQYFDGEQVQLICCSTFDDVFKAMKEDPTAVGMLAIENTIAGSLLHNYELLRESGASVVGEHKLHIQHSICCLPEDDWSTIEEVHSHPVALMQCNRFLANHPKLKRCGSGRHRRVGRIHNEATVPWLGGHLQLFGGKNVWPESA